MMIATIRLDGLCQLTQQAWDNSRNNDTGGGGHRDIYGRGGGD